MILLRYRYSLHCLLLLILSLPFLPACNDEPDDMGDDDSTLDIGGETPTPDQTPSTTPDVTATPDETPDTTPGGTPDETPDTTPDGTPDTTPDSTPDGTPDTTPGTTPDGTPDATPDTTPDTTPDSTPGVTPTEYPQADVDITVSSSSIDFGSVPVGLTESASIVISASGSDDLTVTFNVFAENAGDFMLDPEKEVPSVVPSGESETLWLLFAPSMEGDTSGSLRIYSNDPDEEQVVIPLYGKGEPELVEDFDQDGFTEEQGDCDDNNAAVYPGAEETCDGVDNDCDEEIDEDGFSIYYTDSDGDGYGDDNSAIEACLPVGDYVPVGGDCDDTNATVYPSAPEQCDTKDNDCDAEVDEGVTSTFYTDADGDGHGDGSSPVQACFADTGLASSNDDCDDANAEAYPGNTEVCDGMDNDCDTEVDEDLSSDTYYTDADGDGHGDPNSPVVSCGEVEGTVASSDDCDDTAADTFPGASEACDGRDNNCDGSIDEGVLNTYYTDSDGDSYGDSNTAVEACSAEEGQVTQAGDCDDGDASAYPGATDVCDDKDNNCDGQVDEGLDQTWYYDGDSDSYGVSDNTLSDCAQPDGYVSTSGDCDDGDSAINPAATEVCDGADNNCDGSVDEGLLTTYYFDEDGDSYGDSSTSTDECSAPTDYVLDSSDCDDGDASTHPAADETCDGKDNDCDGSIDNNAIDAPTYYMDYDVDGYGDPAVPETTCTQPSGYVTNDQDCEDNDPEINPDAVDIPGNGVDEDCNGEDQPWLDLNSDGYADLIVPNYEDDNTTVVPSYVYYGGPEGISVFDREDLTTLGAYHACVGDFNDDDHKDVVFANSAAGAITSINSYLYWGSSDGFSEDARLDLPTIGARFCEVSDLDGDGDEDIVFANFEDAGDHTVNSYVYWNVAGTFSTDFRTEVPTIGARSVKAIDIDGNGYEELVFANSRDGSDYTVNSYIYWGAETGYSEESRTSLPTSGALAQPVVVDLNGDSNLDIVMANYTTGSSYRLDSYVYWGPDYESSVRSQIPANGPVRTQVRDFDGDGYQDIAFACYADGDKFNDDVESYVYYGSVSGYGTGNRSVLDVNWTHDISVGDIDYDGYDDLLLSTYTDGDFETTSWIYWGSAEGFDDSSRTGLDTLGAFYGSITDVDGDGFLDAAFTSYSDGNNVTYGYVYWNSSRGISESVRTDVTTYGALHVDTADLNADGYPEVVYTNQYDNSSFETDSYIVWGGDPWGGDSSITALPTQSAFSSCIDDLNGDGYLDIVFANYRSDDSVNTNSFIYWGSASNEYGTDNYSALPTSGARDCLVSDLDQDGDLDLVFSNYFDDSSNETDSFVYWNKDGIFSTASRLGIPTAGAWGAAAADLDDNGYEDLVFSNYTDGSSQDVGIYLYFGDSTGYSQSRRLILDAYGPNKPPIIDDLNQDGYLDILIANTDDGDYNVDSYVYWGSVSGFNNANRTALPAAYTYEAKVADLNLDGWKDIILVTFTDGDDETSSLIYWGSESGYSTSDRTSLSANQSTSVAVADLDLNGLPDLVFSTYWANGEFAANSYVYYGQDDGYSTSYRSSLSTVGAMDVIVEDLDLDGLDEVIFGNYRDSDSTLAVGSPVYWGSLRGLSSSNRTEIPSYASRFVLGVNPE